MVRYNNGDDPAQMPPASQRPAMEAATTSDPGADFEEEPLYQKILSNIQDDIGKDEADSERLLGRYRAAVKDCIYFTDGENDCPTILHWVANQLKTLRRGRPYKLEFQALLTLAEISVHANPKLIQVKAKNISAETPLHIAVGSLRLEPLARRICAAAVEAGKTEVLRKAIKERNGLEETCIHIAIVNGLSIASYLIDMAAPDTFEIKRRYLQATNDTENEGDGNTPLHDAVDFKRCVHERKAKATALRSSTSNQCKDTFRMRHDRILDIITRLVSKNKKALTTRNSAHKTPYLHHLSTKQQFLKPDFTDPLGKVTLNALASETSGSTTPKHVGQANTPGQRDFSGQTEEVVIDSVRIQGNRNNYGSIQVNENRVINHGNQAMVNLSFNLPVYPPRSINMADDQPQYLTNVRGNVVQHGIDFSRNAVLEDIKRQNKLTSAALQDYKTILRRPGHRELFLKRQIPASARPEGRPPPSREPLTLSIGSGNQESKIDQDAKGVGLVISASVDPSKAAIASNCQDGCFGLSLQIATAVEELLRESSFATGDFKYICGCLFSDEKDPDGREPIFRPGVPIEPSSADYYDIVRCTKTLAQVDLELAVIDNTKNEVQRKMLWESNAKALKNIFDMLRHKKGVEQILKLTVLDNIEMPCSDEIIEYCLEGFDIRYLNWRKLDLCPEVILAKAPNLAELTLHASGNNAVLRGWASHGGLCRLDKMTKVTIHAKRSFGDYDRYLDRVDHFLEDLESCVNLRRRKLFLESEKPKLEADLEKSRREFFPLEAAKDRLPAGKERPNVPPSANADELLHGEEKSSFLISPGDDRPLRGEEKLDVPPATNGDRLPRGQGKANALSKDSDMLQKFAHLAIKETKDIIKSIDEQLGQLQEDWEEIEELRSRRRKEKEETRKKRWEQRRANLVLETATKDACVLRLLEGKLFKSGEENQRMRDRKLFQSAQGYVATTFNVHSHREGPPPATPANNTLQSVGATSTSGRVPSSGNHPWIKSVKTFVNKNIKEMELNDPEIRSTPEIKIALIDDGLSINMPELNGCIAQVGWPRQEPTDESQPWYLSTTGHGTAMAKLIILACPKAKLYIAKLGAWEDDKDKRNAALGNESTATKATQAIQWAIEQGVHVICMSWNLIKTPENGKQIEKLDLKVQEAANQHGIIMYCAAADQSLYGRQELYPLSSKTSLIKAIGSAGVHGRPSVFVDDSRVNYLFPGEEIAELEFGKREGSSAATALAVGFASLILWCFERDRKGSMKRVKNPEQMNKVLDGLVREHPGGKWVDVTILLDNGEVDVKTVVNNCKKWL